MPGDDHELCYLSGRSMHGHPSRGQDAFIAMISYFTSEVSQATENERYLRSHKCAAPVSLPFLPNLHTEMSGAWRHPYTVRVVHSASSYSNVEGLSEQGYWWMPWLERNLVYYLSSSLNAPDLPSKPHQVTLRLVGRAYAAAGKTGVALYTVALLQAYQAGLLDLSPEAVSELRMTRSGSPRHQAGNPLYWPVNGCYVSDEETSLA